MRRDPIANYLADVTAEEIQSKISLSYDEMEEIVHIIQSELDQSGTHLQRTEVMTDTGARDGPFPW